MLQSPQPISQSPGFEQARLSMVSSQLYTSGVLSDAVLDAYRSVPREIFVPPSLQGVCYLDDNVKFPNGRFLLEPLVHALMVENAAIKPGDKVLDIGGYTGYSTAILTHLAQYVVALEADAAALDIAKGNWLKLGLPQTTTVPVCAPHQAGCAAYSPYDVIIINGSVAEIPQAIQDQLAPHGRLLCIERQSVNDVGQIRLYARQHGHLGSTVIADATVPYLPGFDPVPAFTF